MGQTIDFSTVLSVLLSILLIPHNAQIPVAQKGTFSFFCPLELMFTLGKKNSLFLSRSEKKREREREREREGKEMFLKIRTKVIKIYVVKRTLFFVILQKLRETLAEKFIPCFIQHPQSMKIDIECQS